MQKVTDISTKKEDKISKKFFIHPICQVLPLDK